MKRAFPVVVAIALISLVAVGCQKKGADSTAGYPVNDSVVDVTAADSSSTPNAYQPVAPQPVVYDSMTTPQAPAPAAPADAPVSGSTYTIKPGDTLYSIAKQRYGEGKQWTRIADANPGLDPTKMPVGKTITIP